MQDAMMGSTPSNSCQALYHTGPALACRPHGSSTPSGNVTSGSALMHHSLTSGAAQLSETPLFERLTSGTASAVSSVGLIPNMHLGKSMHAASVHLSLVATSRSSDGDTPIVSNKKGDFDSEAYLSNSESMEGDRGPKSSGNDTDRVSGSISDERPSGRGGLSSLPNLLSDSNFHTETAAMPRVAAKSEPGGTDCPQVENLAPDSAVDLCSDVQVPHNREREVVITPSSHIKYSMENRKHGKFSAPAPGGDAGTGGKALKTTRGHGIAHLEMLRMLELVSERGLGATPPNEAEIVGISTMESHLLAQSDVPASAAAIYDEADLALSSKTPSGAVLDHNHTMTATGQQLQAVMLAQIQPPIAKPAASSEGEVGVGGPLRKSISALFTGTLVAASALQEEQKGRVLHEEDSAGGDGRQLVVYKESPLGKARRAREAHASRERVRGGVYAPPMRHSGGALETDLAQEWACSPKPEPHCAGRLKFPPAPLPELALDLCPESGVIQGAAEEVRRQCQGTTNDSSERVQQLALLPLGRPEIHADGRGAGVPAICLPLDEPGGSEADAKTGTGDRVGGKRHKGGTEGLGGGRGVANSNLAPMQEGNNKCQKALGGGSPEGDTTTTATTQMEEITAHFKDSSSRHHLDLDLEWKLSPLPGNSSPPSSAPGAGASTRIPPGGNRRMPDCGSLIEDPGLEVVLQLLLLVGPYRAAVMEVVKLGQKEGGSATTAAVTANSGTTLATGTVQDCPQGPPGDPATLQQMLLPTAGGAAGHGSLSFLPEASADVFMALSLPGMNHLLRPTHNQQEDVAGAKQASHVVIALGDEVAAAQSDPSLIPPAATLAAGDNFKAGGWPGGDVKGPSKVQPQPSPPKARGSTMEHSGSHHLALTELGLEMKSMFERVPLYSAQGTSPARVRAKRMRDSYTALSGANLSWDAAGGVPDPPLLLHALPAGASASADSGPGSSYTDATGTMVSESESTFLAVMPASATPGTANGGQPSDSTYQGDPQEPLPPPLPLSLVDGSSLVVRGGLNASCLLWGFDNRGGSSCASIGGAGRATNRAAAAAAAVGAVALGKAGFGEPGLGVGALRAVTEARPSSGSGWRVPGGGSSAWTEQHGDKGSGMHLGLLPKVAEGQDQLLSTQQGVEMQRNLLGFFGRAGVMRLQALVLSQEAEYVEQLEALHHAVREEGKGIAITSYSLV
eukprot:jgi/Mesen1/9154/ME000588S08482